MLKSIARIFALLYLIAFLGCGKQSKLENQSILRNQIKVFTDTINQSKTIKDLYELANDDISIPYSNILIKNSLFDYGVNEYTIDKNLNNLLFFNDTINSISFNNNQVSNLTFSNCKINNLIITSSFISNLKIIDSDINSIEIISSPFTGIEIRTKINDTINKVYIKNCEQSKNVLFNGNFNEVIFDGGQINNLDVTKINTENTSLRILGTKLFYPNFYNNHSSSALVLLNSIITPSSFGKKFQLADEKELLEISSWHSYKTKRIEIFNRFRFVEQSYGILSRKLDESNNKQQSNFFKYKQNKIHTILNRNYLGNKLSVIWNEYFRGNYGTSITPILFTFFICWLIFAFIFLFLGHLNFILFYFQTTNNEGVSDKNSYYITFDKKLTNFPIYLKHCLWFGLSQMVAGSLINTLNFGRFTTLYLTPPRKYFPIGIGVAVSIIQNIIGLILVFNFVSTFISISLK